MTGPVQESRELTQILKNASTNPKSFKPKKYRNDIYEEDDDDNFGKYVQWTTGDGIKYFPSGSTVSELPPGAYEPSYSPERGYYMQRVHVKTEGLLKFPETNSEKVICEIEKFWEREKLFVEHDITYKRGIILWGPPGSGKSCTIQLVMADVIKRNGISVIFEDPNLFIENMRHIREIQPSTPLVVLMEDIDSILETYNESEVLNILDGVESIEKVVFLATTNYPEQLGERILNRPSRFDKRFKMPHPRKKSRQMYFNHLVKDKPEKLLELSGRNLDEWVADTRGMSIAHLKELFTSVFILGDDYLETVAILKEMMEDQPDSKNDIGPKPIGFGKIEDGDDD